MFSSYKPIMILLLAFLVSCERDNISQPVDDGLPPASPAALNMFRERDGEIGIEWLKNSEPDFKLFRIYRSINTDTNLALIDSTVDEFYIDYYLEYNLTYYYWISAVDNYNRESNLSGPLIGRPANLYSPDAPYMIEINARNWDEPKIHLFWYPVEDTDLAGYKIYRDTTADFTTSEENYIGLAGNNEFDDTTNLELLTEYFYRISAVDKGNLTSSSSGAVSDILLNKPELVFPTEESLVEPFSQFRIKTVSEPAIYKIVIQSNELYGIVGELNFSSNLRDSVIAVNFNSSELEGYRKYYWKVYTYTSSYRDPNSFSPMQCFTVKSGF